MANNNYAEDLFQAIDTIVQGQIQKIQFDTTITCEVVDNSQASTYKYMVSDGSTKFYAYGSYTGYKVGDNVYVTVPKGDYKEEKIIVGKKVSDDTTPFQHESALETMIGITGNLIPSDISKSLVANNTPVIIDGVEGSEEEVTYSVIWSCGTLDSNIQDSGEMNLRGYTRLGLSGNFKTLLKDYDCVEGDYGLALKIRTQQDARVTDTLDVNIQSDVLYEDHYLYLSASDMYGDPYNFYGYFPQEAIFDISEIGAIIGMELRLYQKKKPWTNNTHIFKTSKGIDVPYKHEIFGNLFLPNIFVQGCTVNLGYDLKTFSKDEIILYSPNLSTTYVASSDIDFNENGDNDKDVYCRWIHQFEDESIREVIENESLDKNYEIRWYRYALGQQAADKYCGYNWVRDNVEKISVDLDDIDNTTGFNLIIHPAPSLIPDTEIPTFDSTKLLSYAPFSNNNNKFFVFPATLEGAYNIENINNRTDITFNHSLIIPNDADPSSYTAIVRRDSRGQEIEIDPDTSITTVMDVISPDDYTINMWYNDAALTSQCIDATVSDGKKLYHSLIYYDSWQELYNSKFIYYPVDRKIYPFGFWEKLVLGYRIYWSNPTAFNKILGDKNIFTTGGTYNSIVWNVYKGKNPSELINGFNLNTQWNDNTLLQNMINSFTASFGDWELISDSNGYSEYTLGQRVTNNGITIAIADDVRIAQCDKSLKALFAALDNKQYDFYDLHKMVYHFTPDINEENEQVKAIILYDYNALDDSAERVIKSNIISFKNDKKVVNQPTIDALSALAINCEDNTYGEYFCYNPGGQIVDTVDAQKLNTLKVYFNKSELTDFEWIKWKLPIGITSMININSSDCYYMTDNLTEEDREAEKNHTTIDTSEKDFITITRTARTKTTNGVEVPVDPSVLQYYRINNYYKPSASNNTITCIIKKDGLEYVANKQLNFGLQGSSGTDYTLRIEFDDNSFYAFTAGKSEHPSVTAVLFDNQNKIAANLNSVSGITIDWSWYSQGVYYTPAGGSKTLCNPLSLPSDGLHVATINIYSTINNWPKTGNETDGYEYYIGSNYYILQCKVSGYCDYDLVAYKIIPIRNSTDYGFMRGPDTLIYDSAGQVSFSQIPYDLLDNKGDSLSNATLRWEVAYEENSKTYDANYARSPYIPNIGNDGILTPIPFYVKNNTKQITINAYVDNILSWSHPLLILQNVYPSPMLNQWDGSLQVDEENNRVMAATVAAGHKNSNNTFSGVIIGEVEDTAEAILSNQTGVYGYSQGQMSYALLESGTAFFGKSGHGRIWIDGDEAIIKSSSWDNGNTGMKLDLDDGSIHMNRIYTNSIDDYVISNPYRVAKKTTTNVNGVTVTVDVVDSNGNIDYYSAQEMFDTAQTTNDKYYIYRLYELDTDLTLSQTNQTRYIPTAWTTENLTAETYVSNKYFIFSGSGENQTYALATGSFNAGTVYHFPIRFEITDQEYVPNKFFKKNLTTALNDETMKVATQYDPLENYYKKNTASANRYMTLGADQSVFPLSIGTFASEGSRQFRVDWAGKAYIIDGEFSGTINAKAGLISGNLNVTGSLNGGKITGAEISGGSIDIGENHFFQATSSHVKMGTWRVNSGAQSSLYQGSNWMHSCVGLSNGESQEGTTSYYLWAGWKSGTSGYSQGPFSVSAAGVHIGSEAASFEVHIGADKQQGIYARFA